MCIIPSDDNVSLKFVLFQIRQIRLKKLVMLLTLPSKHWTAGNFSALCKDKLRVCMKAFKMQYKK